MNPDYPVYIISKGRWETRLTAKALDGMGVPFRIVIEPQEFEQYAEVINPARILMLPFSNLGQGSIPCRNWVWEHSIAEGAARHWILDDNIRLFWRWNQNKKLKAFSGSIFKAIEDFVGRYENVALAGPNYFMFAKNKYKDNPFRLNTRVYSCLLIDNAISYRWRGKFNEDTDLSLQVLKDGYCTVLFMAFLAEKMTTMSMRGGNTDELYQGDGRLKMAQELQRQHPDVVQIKRRWGRWQHVVDYRPFKYNQLKLKPGVVIPQGVNNYGMVLKHLA